MNKISFFATLFIVLASGCTPKGNTVAIAGKGGTATLVVYPQHHLVARNLVNMKVFIKYNTLDVPLNNLYDDSVSCIKNDTTSSATLTGLANGDYYLFASGQDTSFHQSVKGGSPYRISQQNNTLEYNIPVSE